MKISTLKLLLSSWLLICLLGGLETFMIYVFRPDAIGSTKFYWLPLLRVTNGFAAILLVLYPGHLQLKNRRSSTKIAGYLLLMILFMLVYLIFAVGQFQLAFLSLAWDSFLAGIGETLMTDLHHMASYYLFLLLIVIGKDYFEERSNALIKKEQLQAELNKTQLLVLQRQIQPHFLFNTLNNVVAIIDEHKSVAQHMLVELSELLRASMDMDFSQTIALKEEINMLSLYLSIEKKRFEHQLEYQLNIPPETSKVQVPPFLLQPLAENAIKHGFKENTSSLHLVIEGQLMEDQLILKVKNDGAPLADPLFGIGLKNVQERIITHYGDLGSFTITSDKHWVINEIRIPV